MTIFYSTMTGQCSFWFVVCVILCQAVATHAERRTSTQPHPNLKLSLTVVSERRKRTLQCSPEDSTLNATALFYTFYREGKLIYKGQRANDDDGGVYELSMIMDSSGEYFCEAEELYVGGGKGRSETLRVDSGAISTPSPTGGATFDLVLSTQRRNDTIELCCLPSASHVDPAALSYTFYYEGYPDNEGSVKVTDVGGIMEKDGGLVQKDYYGEIYYVRKELEPGQHHCETTDNRGQHTLSNVLVADNVPHHPPPRSLDLNIYQMRHGNNVLLSCDMMTLNLDPALFTYTFYRNEQLVETNQRSNYPLNNEYSFVVSNETAGTYFCKAEGFDKDKRKVVSDSVAITV